MAKEASIKTSSPLFSVAGINYINIGLMIISCWVAYLIPFELFLLAYAILGPLHYLTEISWLQKKNFYIKSRNDVWAFAVITALILFGALNIHSKINNYTTGLIFSAFVFALIILFVDKLTFKLVALFLVFSLFAVFGLNQVLPVQIIFGLFLPTIMHVFLFTGIFMLYGALRGKSFSGMLSVGVFILCSATFFIFQPNTVSHIASPYIQRSYDLFTILNKSMSDVFGVGTINSFNDVFTNPGAVALMRFIAFAYT
ncbi:MAG TPA: hypothetical protein VK806_14515, partial [Bacteroidia bacterium]|nr:hypothetical protein [Bacteroidia bacterium]